MTRWAASSPRSTAAALLTDNYVYDILGQRTRHWNSFLGSGNVAKTDYDLQGRVVSNIAFGGDAITTAYSWDATIATALGTTGGWLQVDTYANTKTMQVKSDVFGHDTWKSDLGGHAFTYTYDKAGRQLTRATTGETLTTTWLNSGLNAKVEFGVNDYSTFSYDANGNRLTEYTKRANVVVQNATATYDAIGRLVTWNEAGGTVSPIASKTIEYDLNSNIRKVATTNCTIDSQGNVTTGGSGSELFFYDSMNRVTTDKGVVYTYDVAGQRKTATRNKQLSKYLWRHQPPLGGGNVTWWEYKEDLDGGTWTRADYYFMGYERETYNYNADGTLDTVQINADTVLAYGGTTCDLVPMDSGPGTTRADYSYDAMGRLTRQLDDPSWVAYDRTITYNAKGQISTETVITRQGLDNFKNIITNQYGTGTAYALGQVTQSDSDNYKNNNDGDSKDTRTTYTFAWYDGATVDLIQHDRDIGGSNTIYYSDYSLSATGTVNSVFINDGRDRTISFKTDMAGQVIRRDETDNDASKGDPHEVWYRFNGREMAMIGNNGNLDFDYNTSMDKRTTAAPATPGAFRFGATSGSIEVDMHNGLEAINSFSQGAAGGSYTVEGGETLQSIAQAVWGNSSLWYKLAEANGLGGNPTLVEGQVLTLPAGINRSSNNASTFKPYNAAEAIGDTSPTAPKPPKKPKCGGFGMVLLAVVAIAVTVVLTAGVASVATGATLGQSLGAVIGGQLASLTATGVAAAGTTAGTLGTLGAVGVAVAGAAAGSIVSQGINIAVGAQDGFSWKGVALAGLSAGIGQGIGPGGVFGEGGLFGGTVDGKLVSGVLGKVQSGVLRAGLNGMVSSAVSQGVAVATTLQHKFSWAGVAAAGAAAAVGYEVGKGMAQKYDVNGDPIGKATSWNTPGGAGFTLATSGASLIASATTRSVIEGSDFGDNILAGLPDVIGQTIGGIIADGVSGRTTGAPAAGDSDGVAAPDEGPVASGRADGSATEAQEGDIVVIGSRDAAYRPEIDGLPFYLAQQYTRNPRVRMGGNGGPPLTDPRSLQQAFPDSNNAPGGAIIGLADNFLDLTGPAHALTTDLSKAFSGQLVDQIQALDPSYRLDVLDPGGFPSTSQGQTNLINNLLMDRAVAFYETRGELRPLQAETLRFLQREVDAAYEIGQRELKAGRLPVRLSEQEALGNYVDARVRVRLRGLYNSNGISIERGQQVQVNRRAYNTPEGSYSIPDSARRKCRIRCVADG